ncbi:TetR/AcrR family transcriptional regulator [Streptomyces sp. NPDC021212]|uniref:TetR/AcrR family transcriptional regulator n=1 Tax=Streptomyces sp. NPDC021212 TaxID=3365118 RepID=UPI0037AE3B33
MEGAAHTPGTVRPGGRTARTRAAVRDAVLTGLAEHGYPGRTVEYVAERSGVHKTTVYRRWGSVEGLVADALRLAGEDSWTAPDTGILDGDLRALASPPPSGPLARRRRFVTSMPSGSAVAAGVRAGAYLPAG